MWCTAYRELFSQVLDADESSRVRESLQHNHVLGNDRLKSQIERTLSRKLGTGRQERLAKAPASGSKTESQKELARI